MESLKYNQDGNSGFIIESETNNQIAVVWTDTEDETEINELEKLTKLFVASPKLLKVLQGFVRDFEGDYVMNDGRIVDNPPNILINNYEAIKNVLQETLT